jgi:hypothetical protein
MDPLHHARRMGEPAHSGHRYTYAEYLAYERDSGLKHEYDSGEILAVAGDSRRHNALASRISAALELGRRPAERRADRPGEALRQPAD